MSRLMNTFRTFAKDEFGGAMGWNLAWFAILAGGAGFAIDVSNARNAKEHLIVTAEAASHAGLMELIDSGSTSAARAAAVASVQKNHPSTQFGQVIANSVSDIQVTNWDPDTSQWGGQGQPNAVKVTLHRDSSTNNGVSTFLLDWVGLDQWTFASSAATATAPTQKCSNSEGIFASGNIHLRSHNEFGAEVCLHSDEYVTMSNHNSFEAGSHVSMPDLTMCAKCDDDSANPGIVTAAYETKYIMTDIGQWIDDTEDSFLGTGGNSEIKADFFASRSLDSNLSPLSDLGYSTTSLGTGSVVSMTATEFASMLYVPEGLTYNLTCVVAAGGSGGNGNGNGNGTGKNKNGGGSGGGEVTSLDFANAPLRDAAIITDCPLNFSSSTDMAGVLVLTTSSTGISESSGAKIGATNQSCASADRVTIMTPADVHMAAKSVSTNLTFVIDGDIHLASGGSGNSDHFGVAIHTSGDVDITTHHNYYSCGSVGDTSAPEMSVIRHVSSG